ncbi:hypothetical protein U717_05860 [Rhodobacter capsulatus R121]|nr:hypothetical protein U714_05855 [Rhodobacter capsulatus DE442]ETD78530.1 hypothetical protein U717_05860 [Rhodobacter capsulatus R121]ETE54575.1 hypothetical protein U715_05855 [Rhodobacter capsulatus Y262]
MDLEESLGLIDKNDRSSLFVRFLKKLESSVQRLSTFLFPPVLFLLRSNQDQWTL